MCGLKTLASLVNTDTIDDHLNLKKRFFLKKISEKNPEITNEETLIELCFYLKNILLNFLTQKIK